MNNSLKKKKEYKSLKKQKTHYIYQNELDKACFQYEMAYGDFKDLVIRTVFDKVLCEKVFNIIKNPKYDGYKQRELASMFNESFDEKTSGGRIKNGNMLNKE